MRDSTLERTWRHVAAFFHWPFHLAPMNHKLISKKKQVYPVLPGLQTYLDQHGRAMGIPVSYEDLLRFEGSVAILLEFLISSSEIQESVKNIKRGLRYDNLKILQKLG